MPIIDYPFIDINGTGKPKPALPVKLINPANGFDHFTWALIDTGADSTVIPEFIAKKLYHDIKHRQVKTDICFGISRPATTYYHTFRLRVLGLNQKKEVLYNKVPIKINSRLFSVISGLHTMVLGEDDFLKRYILKINYPKKTLSLRLPPPLSK